MPGARRSPLLAVLVAAAILSPPATAIPSETAEQRADRRVVVDSRAAPWQSVGRLNVAGLRARRHCTATLVRPGRALTAWHCLRPFFRDGIVDPRRVHFLPGYDRGGYLDHLRGVGFERIGAEAVLITLDKAGAVPPVPTEPMRLKPGDALFQAGYSGDRAHVLTADPSCRYLGPARNGQWLHDCEAISGDSGAPILRDTGDGLVVVAIHVGRTADGIGLAEPLR